MTFLHRRADEMWLRRHGGWTPGQRPAVPPTWLLSPRAGTPGPRGGLTLPENVASPQEGKKNVKETTPRGEKYTLPQLLTSRRLRPTGRAQQRPQTASRQSAQGPVRSAFQPGGVHACATCWIFLTGIRATRHIIQHRESLAWRSAAGLQFPPFP